jgi:hypothetical protein
MIYEKLDKEYIKILLTDLFNNSNLIDQNIINSFFSEYVNNKNVDEAINASKEISMAFRIICYGLEKKKEEKENPVQQKLFVNGYELTKDYYSLRTEAPKILGESAPTLNKRVEENILQCSPEFPTRKISKEELYRYHKKYQSI